MIKVLPCWKLLHSVTKSPESDETWQGHITLYIGLMGNNSQSTVFYFFYHCLSNSECLTELCSPDGSSWWTWQQCCHFNVWWQCTCKCAKKNEKTAPLSQIPTSIPFHWLFSRWTWVNCSPLGLIPSLTLVGCSSCHQMTSVKALKGTKSTPVMNLYSTQTAKWTSQMSTRSPAKARFGRPYCPINLILTLSPSLIDF